MKQWNMIYSDIYNLQYENLIKKPESEIKSVLEQILSQEYGSLSAIPVPNYYKSKDEQQD